MQATENVKPVQTESERYQKATQIAELRQRIGRVAIWVLLLVGAAAFMMPMYIMIVIALKSPNEMATTSAWAWPKVLTWSNFREVLQDQNVSFAMLYKNTFIISFLASSGALISSAMVAYPFSRLRFRGRDRLFLVLLSTMMLPSIVTMIPTYVLYKYLHWIDTFYPLWVPAWLGGGAFNVFLLRQFFMGIPRELDEAALLDGASHSRIFWQIIIPNSGPALATVGVFAFIYNWRDFLGPLLYLNDPSKQTLEVGLNTFKGLNASQWNLLMAASVMVMLPLILMFIIGQKFFVKGIVMTGGK